MRQLHNFGEPVRRWVFGFILFLLCGFLYLPIAYVIYTSFSDDIVWPFPPAFTLSAYSRLFSDPLYSTALINSLTIGLGSGILSAFIATAGVLGVLRFPSRFRTVVILVFLSPLFVAELIIGISSLSFNSFVLHLPGNIYSAIAANALEGIAFSFLIILAQLVRYDWQMDDAAMVFGASPARCFWEVTLPTIWPSVFGAFLVSFILGFNNLEISFYNLGAIPTLPTVAWGSLRFGLDSELFALASLTNGLVFGLFVVMYVLMKTGVVRFGYRGK